MTPERLHRLLPGVLGPEQARLYDAITSGPRAAAAALLPTVDPAGGLEGPFNPLLYAPELGLAVQQVGAQIRAGLSFTDRERELATLCCAVLCESGYEIEAHRRLALAASVTAAEVAELLAHRIPQSFDTREVLLVTVVSAVAGSAGLTDGLYADAVTVFGERALVELVVLAGYYRMLAGLLDTFRVANPAEHLSTADFKIKSTTSPATTARARPDGQEQLSDKEICSDSLPSVIQ